MVEEDVVINIDSSFDFSAIPYIPVRRRLGRQAAVVYGRAIVCQASATDLERISSWLSQPSVHRALGMRRAPSQRDVSRSLLPDGSGNMEAVEFLTLHESPDTTMKGKWSAEWRNKLPQATGFYLIYQARRAHSAEVDFAFSPQFVGMGKSVAVPLLRAGRIATLAYLMAVCGTQQVQWVRRRKVPGTTRYRTRGPVRIVNVERFIQTLNKIESYSEVPRVIEHQ